MDAMFSLLKNEKQPILLTSKVLDILIDLMPEPGKKNNPLNVKKNDLNFGRVELHRSKIDIRIEVHVYINKINLSF